MLAAYELSLRAACGVAIQGPPRLRLGLQPLDCHVAALLAMTVAMWRALLRDGSGGHGLGGGRHDLTRTLGNAGGLAAAAAQVI